MSITDGLRKAFDDCTVMAGVEADFECVYIAKAAAIKLLDEIDEAFAEGHARAVEYGKASVAGESRWHELFGTPERAARTLEEFELDQISWCHGTDGCEKCPYEFDRYGCCLPDGFSLLEWLRGDA